MGARAPPNSSAIEWLNNTQKERERGGAKERDMEKGKGRRRKDEDDMSPSHTLTSLDGIVLSQFIYLERPPPSPPHGTQGIIWTITPVNQGAVNGYLVEFPWMLSSP